MPSTVSGKTLPTRARELRTIGSLKERQLLGQRVLVRVDLNVPIIKNRVKDTSRITAIQRTVQHIRRSGGTVILIAHRGRPEGRDPGLSLRPVLLPLRKILNHPVFFITTPVWSDRTAHRIASLAPGDIALLENIRFEPGEANHDDRLAHRLSTFADLAVNEAFSDSHRNHASISGVANYLPMYAGFGLYDEARTLERLLRRPRRPYMAVIGGAKISTKVGLLRVLLKRADAVLLGGALANTVLKAEGVAVGSSLIEPRMIRAAKGLRTTDSHLHIPVDVVVSGGQRQRPRVCAVGKVRPHERILDIGQDTVELFARALRTARTVVWNGPMGMYEIPPFDRGTKTLARRMSRLKADVIAGGGETLDAIRTTGTARKFRFLSTGGGALLEWIEGKDLPGIRACAHKRL